MSVPGALSVNLYFALIIFVIVIACFLFLFFNKILDWFVLGGGLHHQPKVHSVITDLKSGFCWFP